MFELPVAALAGNPIPAVLEKPFYDLTDFHADKDSSTASGREAAEATGQRPTFKAYTLASKS